MRVEVSFQVALTFGSKFSATCINSELSEVFKGEGEQPNASYSLHQPHQLVFLYDLSLTE